MIFLDANVVVYAYYLTERKLQRREQELKEASRRIIKRIDGGEPVLTSVVHFSEIANVLIDCYSHQDLSDLLKAFYFKENVVVADVSHDDYLIALDKSSEVKIKINDCLAFVLMEKNNIDEIYTFDTHFSDLGKNVLQE